MRGRVTIFVAFAQSGCFLIEAVFIAGNHPMPIKQAKKKLLPGLVIQIVSPKILQESTTILQLKIYIAYVVRTLVRHPP